MANILGIDTGGTYTDGALISFPDGRLISKIKTPTLHNDLEKSIAACISGLEESERRKIARVCLSTTLATNAIVEGRHCPTGLLLIGGRPKGELPTEHVWEVDGRLDIMGREKRAMDIEMLSSSIEDMRGRVEAVAISGYASVRNPEHEIEAAKHIKEKLNIPTVCAHELTGDLGFYERSVTAVLNAGLIPTIRALIEAVEGQLKEFGIRAPLMIVRGNGMLMSAGQAKLRPIETILSGPAASISGGAFLSGIRNAMVLDMGGTTSDMALISEEGSELRENGAYVGGWSTRVQALKVFTCGLGGDSRIRKDINGNIVLEAERVIPYCRAALEYPLLKEEIKEIFCDKDRVFLSFRRNELESFVLVKDFIAQSESEEKLKDALSKRPHTIYKLRQDTMLGNAETLLNKMSVRGFLKRIAITPTDILHAIGKLKLWDGEISKYVIEMWAAAAGKTADEHGGELEKAVCNKIVAKAIEASFFFDGQKPDKSASDFCEYIVKNLLMGRGGKILDVKGSFKAPVVAVGAPAGAWTHAIGKYLDTDVIYPENGEVAGAVGSAVGKLLETEKLVIRYDRITDSYILFSAQERKSFGSLDEAEKVAKELGRKRALKRLPDGNGKVSTDVRDLNVQGENGEESFVERRIIVTASAHEKHITQNKYGGDE